MLRTLQEWASRARAPVRPCLCGPPMARHNPESSYAGFQGDCIIAALSAPSQRIPLPFCRLDLRLKLVARTSVGSPVRAMQCEVCDRAPALGSAGKSNWPPWPCSS
eukprot:1300346-Pyramimonas_sp.AAC.1